MGIKMNDIEENVDDNSNTDWLNLKHKVCVVTGAAGGIGAAVVGEFLSAGARVVLLDLDVEACRSVAKSLDPSEQNTLVLKCDISQKDSIESAAKEVAKTWGQCDVLVNNAGILRPGELSSLALGDWEKMLRVNLTGYLLTTQIFGKLLQKQGGAIVHVSSISASHPQPFSGAYSPSKAAITMLSRQLAFELGPTGVRSNVVSPGMIRTPLSEAFYQAPGITEKREAVVPMRRIGTGTDIAEAVIFLASGRASYINGQEILVDGGFAQTLMSHVPRPGFDE